MTGLEQILISIGSGFAGVVVGKVWGSGGKVTMERCNLVHKAIEARLGRIEDKLDQLNGHHEDN
jgi:hypothetical protein